MEKKLNGKDLKANDAKPIIQKNVPGFQDKCSKEIINAYNRVFRGYILFSNNSTNYHSTDVQIVQRKVFRFNSAGGHEKGSKTSFNGQR